MHTELLSRGQPYEYYGIRTATNIKQIRDLGEGLGEFLSGEMPPELHRELLAKNKPFINALLMSGYNSGSLPPEYRQGFGVEATPELDMKPEIYHESWYLCSSSETAMWWALEDQTVMLAGSLVLKLTGRITGLCVRSFSTEKGTFIKGNFYSPDGATKVVIICPS